MNSINIKVMDMYEQIEKLKLAVEQLREALKEISERYDKINKL